jgi:hypothetical protein
MLSQQIIKSNDPKMLGVDYNQQTDSKNQCRRTKERRIGFVIDKVI